MRYAMIMAGGAGTRLWPMSRGAMPKQLVPFIRGRSLLQIAAERLEGLVPPERRYICTGEVHRAPIRTSLPDFSDEQLLGEPMGRDTVNAVGFTAAVLAKLDPDAIFAVFTADHIIEPAAVFRERVDLAFRLVEQDERRLVTFSIKPTHPATGFGYVQRGEAIDMPDSDNLAFNVKRYVEKPDLETAKQYLASGDFGWNSGMFVWKASTVLDAIRRFKPESHAGLMKIAEAWDTDRQTATLNEVYPKLPKTSVDYAVMEPACADPDFKVCTVLTDVSWRDVGSWPSYGETLEPDGRGNRTALDNGAEATLLDCDDTLIVSNAPKRRIAMLGVKGLVVVDTPDATLIMPEDQAERLKELHGLLPDELK
ncbi:MAG: mannose-1-phosphate guanylyltransferase [Phycisphaeraceae bacterium]|nr:MAG: mannose-1-phosphate guanylyltransferase [Phycisphaeraceae bacterium]